MRQALLWILFAVTGLTSSLFAEEKVFTLDGATLLLQDVSAEVDVYYRSMRWNRALNVWNVEATLINHGSRSVPGPWVLLVESYQNTTGPRGADGFDDSTPPKPFYDFTALVPNGELATGQSSGTRTLALGAAAGSPSLVTRVYAGRELGGAGLALARTVNDVGQPLPGVQTAEEGPTAARTYTTDPVFGVVTVGQGSGGHVWKFSAPGYLPVWRQQNLSTNVAVLANPRLTPLGTNVVVITTMSGGQLITPGGSIQIRFSPGAMSADTPVALTPLSAQTLPGFLPLGWSPLQAFWVEGAGTSAVPATVALVPWGPFSIGETAALARWNESAVKWEVAQLLTGDGTNAVSTSITASGAYALVVGDVAPNAPPVPQVGQALLPVQAVLPDVTDLSAAGSVAPTSSPASRRPESVTATAEVVITNRNGALPSGLVLRCEVTESYRLNDSTRRRPPHYESFVVGYQRPGDTNATTLHTRFPLRPLLLFGAEELAEATVKVDVLAPTPFGGGVLDVAGGLVSSEGVRVLAGTNDVIGRQAALLRRLDTTNFVDFATNGIAVAAAFEFSMAGVAPDHRLVAQFESLPATTNRHYVLARVLYDRGQYGLLPVERLASDSAGKLLSAEPSTGERLPGVNGSGQYLLLQVPSPLGLVRGVASDATGQPTAGLPVRIVNQPWLSFSGTNGAFRLVAPTGTVAVAVTDLGTGNSGSVQVNLPNAQAAITANVGVVAVRPRVVSVTPQPGASAVSRVAPVIVTFSKPVNPATLLGDGLQLVGASNQVVEASLNLNLQNTTATLLPTRPLLASTMHTLRLSPDIADPAGMKLEGTNAFTFRTELEQLQRISGEVTSYEPVDGMAGMTGRPGIAEPESPVVLVNETSGYTATVLSKPDGSFSNSIPADVDDFLSVVIVNENGTRNEIAVSRQVFRDGSIALFNSGGTLEVQGEAGPVQVIVEPGSIPSKTKFKLESVTMGEVLTAVSNTPPESGRLLGGFKYGQQGDDLRQSPHVAFSVRPEELGLPPGWDPTNVVYGLTVPREIDGEVVYEIIDQMHYENGRLVTHSFGLLGMLFIHTQMTKTMGQVLVAPMLIAMGSSFVVEGRTLVGTNQPLAGRRGEGDPLSGAVISIQPGWAYIDRPGRLKRGAYMATSYGPNATYWALIPVDSYLAGGGAVNLLATHPRFYGKAARQSAILPPTLVERAAVGNMLPEVDLVFLRDKTETGPDTQPPAVAISHAPFFPAPGSTGIVRVVATDNCSIPSVDLKVDSVRSSVADVNVVIQDVGVELRTDETVGALGKRRTYAISCARPAVAVFKVEALDGSGNQWTGLYTVDFGGSSGGGDNPIPAPDPHDRTGPWVISSVPAAGSRSWSPGNAIKLQFSEPVDRAILGSRSLIQISPPAMPATMELSPDQEQLTLRYPDLSPDTEYTLTVTSGVLDLSQNSLDQRPDLPGPDSFTLTFRTAPINTGLMAGMEYGSGIVSKGIYGYALERLGALEGGVVVYDLSNPKAPARVKEFSVPIFPRDLLLIPQYSFRRTPTAPVETRDLLVVVGGRPGAEIAMGQFLWVIDVSTPLNPKRVASCIINISPSTVINRLRWSPPILGYLELGETCTIGLANLQSFIIGMNSKPEEWPAAGAIGEDLNGDGDYVDPGESLPMPPRYSIDYAGKVYSVASPDSEQLIRDFALEMTRGVFVGVVMEAGRELGTNRLPTGIELPACYRTLFNGPLALPREQASFVLTNRVPTRLSTLFGASLVVDGELQVMDLALVSAKATSGNTNYVMVLDITDRLGPRLLTDIPIPSDHGRPPYTVVQREDGLLVLATLQEAILIDPRKFADPFDPASPTLHPAIVGFLPSAGSGSYSYFSSICGLAGVNQGGNNRVVQTAPTLQFIKFPNQAPFDPSTWATLPEPELLTKLSEAQPAEDLRLSRFQDEPGIVESTLTPPSPDSHYYVLVHAPGSAGKEIDLCLQGLNWAGTPLRKRGLLFPPVHAMSAEALVGMGQLPDQCESPVSTCTAYRLSTNAASAAYNCYLSRPIALVYEEMSTDQIKSVKAALDREILWSGSYLRATLDPRVVTNVVIGAFASMVDDNTREFLPGPVALAKSFPADYLHGPNPMPLTGGTLMPMSLGNIGAHNAGLSHTTVDMSLAGRRLSLEFRRTSEGQALYFGPFGRGWDFNYNQRLVECDPAFLPQGMRIPVVVRKDSQDCEVAESKDLLFITGGGRVVPYRYTGTNPPPEIQNDELAKSVLKWFDSASAFYLPPAGVFDYIVKFKDGRFGRLEPDGMQYWYDRRGRLIKVYDRYDKNSLEMVYNRRGELVRILDELKRPLSIGYYRLNNDDFQIGLDLVPQNLLHCGLICRLKDYTDREIFYEYTEDGLLEQRRGPEVTTHAPGSFSGWPRTQYRYSSSSDPSVSAQSLLAVITGDRTGTPLVSANTQGSRGRDTVDELRLYGSPVKVEMNHANTARAISEGGATTTVTGPDSSQSKYSFDRFARPLKIELTGNKAPAQGCELEYYDNGLVRRITYPEGNQVEYTYEQDPSAPLRSKGNVVQVRKIPGSRGGTELVATTQYDWRYNLPAGKNTDFSANEATIQLASDGRDKWTVTKGGETERYQVNEHGQLIQHIAADGVVRAWSYNQDGWIHSQSVGDYGCIYSYGYSSGKRGLPSSITDPRQIQTNLRYDERNRVVRRERAGLAVEFCYDEQDNIAKVDATVDSGVHLIEERQYTPSGFMSRKTVYGVEVDGSPTELTTTFVPDEMNRVKLASFPGGDKHEIVYDHVGHVTDYRINNDYTEHYEYDRNGNRTSVTIGDGTQYFEYDGHDRLTNIVTAEGTKIGLAYSGNGKLVGKTIKDANDQVLAAAEYVLDELDRYRKVTRLRDSGSVLVKYDYNLGGPSVVMTDQLGAFSRTHYDANGRLTREETPTRVWTYDHYDPNGNILSKTCEEGGREYTVTYDYNDRDQVYLITDQLGHSTALDLGLDGRIRSLTDRKGHITRTSHSVLGEMTGQQNNNNVSLDYGFTPNRELHTVSDGADNTYKDAYDSGGRRISSKLPNGAETTYRNFNALGQPERILMPRGLVVSLTYDKEGKVKTRSIGGRSETYDYDGMQRLKKITDPFGELSFTYDKLGFIRKFSHKYTNPPLTFDVNQEADDGGFRLTVTYPFDGATLASGRDITGRLKTLTPNGGEPVIQETTYATDSRAGSLVLGARRIRLQFEHDDLQRPIAQRYQRMSDGATLVDVRYSYDRDGAQEARQYLHRAGRADFFHYDNGHRLTRADIGVRPLLSGGESGRQLTDFAVPSEVPGGWAPGLHARSMSYTETDVLKGITTINPDGLPLPPLAERYGAPDSLLFVSEIDGFLRGCDEIGQVTRTRLWVRLPDASAPAAVDATLTYNELGQLTRIERDDGVVVENDYGPNSLRIRRTVTGDPVRCVPSDTAFLYDGPNVIEEWDLMGGARLRARYFYGDDGDELLAGDLLSSGGILERHYFLTDIVRSVLAVTDAQGQMQERMTYDAWGQPVIERPDTAAPVVSQIIRTTDGVLVAFSETVLPAFASTPPARNLFRDLVAPGTVLEVRVAGTNVSGQVVYEESSSPYRFGSVFRFDTIQPLTGNVQLIVRGGTVQDEWNLVNAEETFTLNMDVAAGTVLYAGPVGGSTAPIRVARSTMDSPFLFHGQVFDYDTGLLYCRSRFYDPSVGMFLQRDGTGYADGPNQYAGFGNNPICLRDPTGQAACDYAEALQKKADEQLKKKEGLGGSATALAYETMAAALNLGTKLAEGIDLLQNRRYGVAGFLDAMNGASLITTDIGTGFGLGASMYGGYSFCRGATAFAAEWKRMNGWMAKVGVPLGRGARAGEFMASKGVDAIAARSLHMTMKDHQASVILRENRDPEGRLKAIDQEGMSGTKPVWLPKELKTEGGVVTYEGHTYVSDIDVAEVFINGKPASKVQRQRFLMDWNRNFAKLWRMEGRTGKPPVPVKHSTHFGMFDEIGNQVPSREAEAVDGYVTLDRDYVLRTGNPGDCITVRLDGKGNLVAYQTPRAQIHRLIMERGELLRNMPTGTGGAKDWFRFEPEYNRMMRNFFSADPWKKPYWERERQ